MSFEDELKLIKDRAGVVEAEVADLGAKRAEKERQQASSQRSALRQENYDLMKRRQELSAQLVDTIAQGVAKAATLVIQEDPEIMQEMGVSTPEEALRKVLEDKQFVQGQVDPTIDDIERQVYDSLARWFG